MKFIKTKSSFLAFIFLLGWIFYFFFSIHAKAKDPQYILKTIAQQTHGGDSLKTEYLAECLKLSRDDPVNLYQIDIKEKERLLKSLSFISQAKIKKILPHTLFVSYELRQPVALILDLSNAAIDKEGILFPLMPFFTPKNLPGIYLGMEDGRWGDKLNDEKIQLAFHILKSWKKEFSPLLRIKTIDVSKVFSKTFGEREIVLVHEDLRGLETAERSFLHHLRLPSKEWKLALSNYFTLMKWLEESAKPSSSLIVDMRNSHLAFLKEEDSHD